jgi:hypothetical protein
MCNIPNLYKLYKYRSREEDEYDSEIFRMAKEGNVVDYFFDPLGEGDIFKSHDDIDYSKQLEVEKGWDPQSMPSSKP